MAQKAITVVIDEFSAAVARLAEHAPPEVIDELREATGDLLEAFGTAAQVQATQFAMLLRSRVDALDKRTERRHVDVGNEQRRVDD